MESKNGIRGISAGRVIVYVVGVAILAFGISCNTKTGLGVSPVISVAFSIATILGAPIGIVTFIYYCALVVIEVLLLKGKLPIVQYLQVISSFITSAFLQVYDGILPSPAAMPARLVLMCVGIFFTGLGASLMVGMKLIPNPADGLADVIGRSVHKDLGMGKNILDALCIITAAALGLLFRHRLLGIGIGTVCAVIFTGRVMALVQGFTNRVYEKVE